jgi:uncharacterized integral membrane protein
MVRKLSILIVVTLLAIFVWLNWNALSTVTTISLGWTTVEAPLGLVLLVPLVVLCVVLPAWAISLHARVLRDVRAIAKALQQRELADREQAARLVDLRIDFLKALEAGVNSTAAGIGELEDRMERANLLPRGDDPAGAFHPLAQAVGGKE